MARLPGALATAAWLALLAVPAIAGAQTSDNILVVLNSRSEVSVKVGEHYIRARGIAADHVVRLETSTQETIERADFIRTIDTPVALWLARHALQDCILYIVLAKDIPIRIAGTSGRDGTSASVDSELTLLYRRMVGSQVPIRGRIDNPYFLGDRPVDSASRFTRFTADTYLVTRLDGFTADDAVRLVDRAGSPSRDGRVVLDQRASPADRRGADLWLADAAAKLEALAPGRAVLEKTSAAAIVAGAVAGYYSWGTNDPANPQRRFGLEFVNGAIGGTFVGNDARTFAEPAADSPQLLAADLVRDGLTGIAAHVDEPYLDAIVRPQVLFPAYLNGFNLAESFYLAMPFLSWQTLVLGDPLCAPFARDPLGESEIHAGIDEDTGLPALFAERRMAVLAEGGLNQAAVKLLLKAGTRASVGDTPGQESLLIKAADLEPRLSAANLQLAMMYQARADYDRAIVRFRRIVASEPLNAIALNDLAFLLAVHAKAPAEALPLAERAARLSDLPTIADTLGWIHHLLGADRVAAPLLERAVAGLPKSAPTLIHAAVVHAALGDLTRARQELDAALAIDASVADSPDVQALRRILKLPLR